MAFCNNCGHELNDEAKFCDKCGKPVNKSSSTSERKTVYEGEIHKCPNCGEILSSFIVTCPTCGNDIRGSKVTDSIREFSVNLADANNNTKRIMVIQSFPIPNNKEDILEFLILASTNFNTNENLAEYETKDISNAWLAKVEQCYQKAKLLFYKDSDFSKIQSVYNQTISRIKISAQLKRRKTIAQLLMRTIGLWGGLLIFVIAFIIDIASYSNTSMIHLGAATIMIVGAFIIGKKDSSMLDACIGVASGLSAIMLGMLLQEVFYRNGSVMVLGGGATLIISIIRLIKSTSKK